MDNAFAQVAYENFTLDLEKQNIPEEEKEKIRKEAQAAHEKGTFMDYVKTMAKKEQAGSPKILTDKNFKNISHEQIIEFIQNNKNTNLYSYSFLHKTEDTAPASQQTKPSLKSQNKIMTKWNLLQWIFTSGQKSMITRKYTLVFGLSGVPHSIIVYKEDIISRIAEKQNTHLQKSSATL